MSISAIQYLNTHYIQNDQLTTDDELEFINRCFFYLNNAFDGKTDDKTSEYNLLVIQRTLLLLKNHCDLFVRRYSYDLRIWSMIDEPIVGHSKALVDTSQHVHVQLVCLLDAINLKFHVKTNLNDFIGDLKAQIHVELVKQLATLLAVGGEQQQQQQHLRLVENYLKLIDNNYEDEHVIRLTFNGHELVQSMNNRLLTELQPKDNQVVHLTVQRSPLNTGNTAVKQRCTTVFKIQRSTVPILILSQEPYFTNLFTIITNILELNNCGQQQQVNHELDLQIRLLAAKTWDIIMLLPTNKNLVDVFLTDFDNFFYRFLYAIDDFGSLTRQIVDDNNTSMDVNELEANNADGESGFTVNSACDQCDTFVVLKVRSLR